MSDNIFSKVKGIYLVGEDGKKHYLDLSKKPKKGVTVDFNSKYYRDKAAAQRKKLTDNSRECWLDPSTGKCYDTVTMKEVKRN